MVSFGRPTAINPFGPSLTFAFTKSLTSNAKTVNHRRMKNNNINGHHWKTLREKAGLTQRDVSEALGYSTPQFISNVERGRCRFPVEKLGKIKKLYKLSANQIVDLILNEERQGLLKILKKAR